MKTVEGRVLQVFQSVLMFPTGLDTDLLKYNQYPGWDSVAHMTIVANLEGEFDCMLEMQEILDMSSFEKALETMRKYGG